MSTHGSQKSQVSIGMVSLGCPKNLVDSEVMLGLLKSKRYALARNIENCDIALINTCAFIEDSRQESINHILELAEMKKAGKIKALIVCGCLPQRYYKDLQKEISEIDAMVGTGEYGRIDTVIEQVLQGAHPVHLEDTRFIYDHSSPRYSLTPAHYKYIKVGEGCDHRCTFCIIPALRGDYRSRPIESIETEIRQFVGQGMIEANLISQDTSYYGRDIDGRYRLAELLGRLERIEGLKWIRLFYNHPVHMTEEILNAIRDYGKVCKYVDMPLQHISDNMLKSMKRGMNKANTTELLWRMRQQIPGLALRTTFIVGYPGETEEDFRQLHDFVKEMRFERLGVFPYSRGDDKAAGLDDQVPAKIKEERRDVLMRLQQEISLEQNRSYAGQTLEVLIDEPGPEKGLFEGRTYRDAPEIDGRVIVRATNGKEVKIGKLYRVRIQKGLEYDLEGEIVCACD